MGEIFGPEDPAVKDGPFKEWSDDPTAYGGDFELEPAPVVSHPIHASAAAPTEGQLSVGHRVALPMRRGTVSRVDKYGFWMRIDDAPEDVTTRVGFDQPWMLEAFEAPEPRTLRERLQRAINASSAENGSGTPDFVLAEYLHDCLLAFDRATGARERWRGTNFEIRQDFRDQDPSRVAEVFARNLDKAAAHRGGKTE